MLDYASIGLKCGIEIHQRLETGRKLFCRCSSALAQEEPVLSLTRQLRPVVGELGKIDPAALYELLRDRTFRYEIYDEQCCLVESDGEPPFPLDPQALKIALTIAKMLKMDVPDELHVMRKTVVDGSNTGGFQRTTVVGMGNEGSVIETSQGPVRVKDLELEEESAGIVSPAVYRLDRLGIPLVEIGTHPDITSPKQAYETAMAIGQLLRLTHVQRGLGTIRQDVNVSIRGGARVEVKGLQEIEMLSELVERECERQLALLEIRELVKKKKFADKPVDVTDVFADTKNKLIKRAGGRVFAGTLPFAGLMKRALCKGKTFGKELAEYAAAYGPKGIIHTEEDLDKYGLKDEFAKLPLKGEVVFVAAGPNAEAAVKAVLERAKFCAKGVPEETRVAGEDGLTAYARPLPGRERMYPETDVAPVRITEKLLDSISLPKTLEERKKFLGSLGISKDQEEQLLLHEKYSLFEKAVRDCPPRRVAVALLELVPYLRRDGKRVDGVSDAALMELFKLGRSLDKQAMLSALEAASNGASPKESVSHASCKQMSDLALEKEIDKLIKEKKAFISAQGPRAFAGLMGEATQRLPGQDGSKIAKMLKKKLS